MGVGPKDGADADLRAAPMHRLGSDAHLDAIMRRASVATLSESRVCVDDVCEPRQGAC